MSEIWDRMIECEQQIIKKCATLGEETFDDPEFDWLNRVFKGDHFRRAHIDSVDARDTKGLYMTHICVFPNFNNTAPIYGFDIMSLYQMMAKTAYPTKNPYNRNELPKDLLTNMNFLLKFSHIFFKKVVVAIDEPVLDNTKLLEMKCISLFQEINNLFPHLQLLKSCIYLVLLLFHCYYLLIILLIQI